MTDWRYYVRNYPKLSFAAAAAVGYLLVPAKRKLTTAREFAAARAVGPGNVETTSQASLTERLLSTAARLIIRNGVPLVSHEAMRLWQQRGGRPPEADSYSPLETSKSPSNEP
jgi:hypothetical protein